MATITNCTLPVWGDATHTHILCKITIEGSDEVFPFSAVEKDPELHGQKLWANLIAGDYGPIGDYIPPPTPPVIPGKPISGKVVAP